MKPTSPLLALFFLALAASTAQFAGAQEVKVKAANLRVKAGSDWVSTSGALFRIRGQKRDRAASIDTQGNLDSDVLCKRGEKFEAESDSLFDSPAPPPRACGEVMEFQFSRPVFADWTKENGTHQVKAEAGPYVFSELRGRSLAAGNAEAAGAFNDAAISSTAKLLGDEKLDRFVVRDPTQNNQLVFNEAGVEALKKKQKESGVTASGQLDAKTQAIFLRDLPGTRPDVATATPAVTCGSQKGALLCSSGPADQVPKNGTAATIHLPAKEVLRRESSISR